MKDDNIKTDILLYDEDKKFAQLLAHEFQVPFDGLCTYIGKLRYFIQVEVAKTEQKEIQFMNDYFFNLSYVLFDEDSEIQSIDINTNKGTIQIKPNDYLFKYFKASLRKIELISNDYSIKGFSESFKRKLYKKVATKIETSIYKNWKINSFKKVTIAAWTLTHFKLEDNPTKEEWEANPTISAQDYKHYLYDKYKSRFKAFLKK